MQPSKRTDALVVIGEQLPAIKKRAGEREGYFCRPRCYLLKLSHAGIDCGEIERMAGVLYSWTRSRYPDALEDRKVTRQNLPQSGKISNCSNKMPRSVAELERLDWTIVLGHAMRGQPE